MYLLNNFNTRFNVFLCHRFHVSLFFVTILPFRTVVESRNRSAGLEIAEKWLTPLVEIWIPSICSMATPRRWFVVISRDFWQIRTTITLRNVRRSKVDLLFELLLICLDVKLNLQETDYGNFLSEEVLIQSVSLRLVSSHHAWSHSKMRSAKARSRVVLHASSGHSTARSFHGHDFVPIFPLFL